MATHNTYKVSGVYVNTTDATPAVAATFQTRTDKAYQVVAKVTGTPTAPFGAIAAYLERAGFYRVAGDVVQEGSSQSATPIETGGLAACACVLSATGTTIIVTVTGIAGTPMTWLAELEIQEVGLWIANGGLSG
jgi:2-keto-4-pentenoate hydratase